MKIDLLDVVSYSRSQPHDQFAWLRNNDPVHWHDEPDGPGFWAVTRYDDVSAVGRDPQTYSSSPTIMIADSTTPQDGVHQMMLMADPPVHTRMRRLVNREFTPRATAQMQGHIDGIARGIIDAVVERGECDLVTDIAGVMPSFVIADMLGIPQADGLELYHHTEALHSSSEVIGREAQDAAFAAMYAYAAETFARKAAEPGDDLASLIVASELDGRPCDEMDFFLWFLLLVDAGGDTTRNLVGGGMQALFEHPDQLALLMADIDGVLPTAVEELLRWVSPVIYMRRTVTEPAVLAGQALAEGDKVVMYYGAANRDPVHFDEPERLDLLRTPNRHVAFGGGGPHFCLGAHLARIEITAILRELLTRLGNIAPAGEPTWMDSNFIFGPTSLPVSFAATSG